MAGHSHWAGIKHKKAAVDAKRGKLFSKLAKHITSAARSGGGDLEMNLRLKYAIEKARAANMPKDNIERALKKGTGELEGETLEELTYEGYGPGGVAVYVEVLTDNRNRTAAEMRHLFDKRGGNMGENGCVAWMFEKKSIFQVAEDRHRKGFIPLRISAEESLAQIEELTERAELITGVATGFPQFDEMTAGLQKGDLIILAARPSMGKTAFALNIITHAALHGGAKIGVFSLEMSHHQLFMRMLCAVGQVDAHRLRTGRIGKDEWQRIIKAFGELSDAPVFIDDTPGVGIMEMRAKCRRLKLEHGCDMIVVDYLQLMRGRGRYDNRQQEISDISRSLKELAKELNCPVVSLSQLSRAPEQRGGQGGARPQLSDLRESGAIEQDADVVMFLFREEVYKKDDPDLKGKAELIIGKQRNGPIGTVDLHFLREFTRFVNPEFREF